MTTATDIWRPGRDAVHGSVAASLAMNATAWAAVGAPLIVVDHDPLGEISLAAGEVEVDGEMTDFGVLAYGSDKVSHLVVGGPYDERSAAAAGVLRELIAARLVKREAVLEIVGHDEIPRVLGQQPKSRAAEKGGRVVERARATRDTLTAAKRRRTKLAGIKKTLEAGERGRGAKREIAREMTIEVKGVPRRVPSRRQLTGGELKVLALLEDGKRPREIAGELSIQPATVRKTMRKIERKHGTDAPEALSAALGRR